MSAAPKIVPADPQAWRRGFLNLRSSVVPCPGLTMQSWAGMHEKCVDFLDRWADEAVGLGWTTLDLSGVHPEVGLIRPDYCGGIVMSGDKMSALTANRIAFVNTAHYRDTPSRRAPCQFGCLEDDRSYQAACGAHALARAWGPD